ncbi:MULTISPECIES: type II toxin-antitoxin system RelE/ParE family toxin [Marinomonas]|uniref:RelE toxin of RelEB toxin-antitoxin system n=1 Tax=Marinomonas alcarazii TaxID=491949 RepID=A0A318UZG8_9GAMM|nr:MULTISPECIES: type II toxin-antitoxin system RelE/ParE family toxin [Marinomonas]PYF81063.1 RelE toxin of RelEB toxin-antitoxin system [Marinomonas alcarazii]
MVIVETPIFTKLINEIMSDDEYKELQEALVIKPDLGVLIKNSGGLRKIRWSVDGRGKRGGIRIIYYWMTENEQLYMMYIFPKNTQENLTDAQTKALRQIVERWSQ